MNSFSRSLLRKTAVAALVAGAVVGSASGAPVALQDVPLYLLSRADPNVLHQHVGRDADGRRRVYGSRRRAGGMRRSHDVGGNSVGACYLPAYEYIGYFNPQEVLLVRDDAVQPDQHGRGACRITRARAPGAATS